MNKDLSIKRWVVTFVEYGDCVDGKARVLGLYATHEEAHDEMSKAAERYLNDLDLGFIKVYKDSASVGSTDECGCEYGIEKVTIPIYKGEIA